MNRFPTPFLPRLAGRSLLTALGACLVLAACGGGSKGASQTAAKVNKSEITVHQINFVLQQQRGLRPEQADAASARILERLIDQELAVQRAEDLQLDRDPRVVQQLEAVRREVLARAYAERVGEAASKPSPEEVQAYFDANPALFSQRRIYNLQEVNIEASPEQVDSLRTKLSGAQNVAEFVEYLKSTGLRFAGNQAVRAAEQLPLASLKTFAAMKDGQAVLTPNARGAQLIVLAGSREQPVSLDQARPAIEQFLLNERKRKLIEDDRQAQRAAATIQYVGKFAELAASAPAGEGAAASSPESAPVADPPAPQAEMPAPPPQPPASGGLDADAISKGMGLKQ
jgi:EpsD family peptidyl-prolyl cis-trans isomerase